MSVFQDKIAFVTGGGSGLGRALCEELAAGGAFSIVTDIDGDAAARVAESIRAAGGRASAMQVDVSDSRSVLDAVDRAAGQYGRLDYMFNNAGVIILSELRDMTPEHWAKIISVNLLGVVHGTTAAYTHMVKQGHGHIVNIASLAGLVHTPTYAAYAMTKHAVVGLTTSLRPEAASLGVKISVVCPGPMETGMGAAATIVQADRSTLERLVLPKGGRKKESLGATEAARIILRGVRRNKPNIVFPFTARLLWRMHRIHPALQTRLDSWFVNTLRAARIEKVDKSDAQYTR